MSKYLFILFCFATLFASGYQVNRSVNNRDDFFQEERQEEERILRINEILEATEELRQLYPDSDNWIQSSHCGDIPLLADPDYIRDSFMQGYFSVSTPSELASFCYIINTSSSEEEAMFAMELTADIDLSGYEWTPMGWTDEHPFKGFINGNNHTISNLKINSNGQNIGFIGWETFSRVVNLNIVDAKINGGSNVAVMTGQAICGSYENCYVQGIVNGSSAGSMLGHSTSDLLDCTADVIVNGEEFNFLTSNEKAISEIEIENPVEITIDENYTVTRPEVTGYQNLGWHVSYNGQEVLSRNAENEYSYTYFLTSPGEYEIYLDAWVSGQYVPISNTVKYTIPDYSE